MTKSFATSFLAVVVVIAVILGADLLLFLVACEHRAKEGVVVLDHGYAYARADESTFVCEARHCFLGSGLCHEERTCICADRGLAPEGVAAVLDRTILKATTCRLDRATPTRTDESACRHAHCRLHLDDLETLAAKRASQSR